MNIENYRHVLTDENYLYFLHGTGAAGTKKQRSTIKSIFKNGLLVNLSPTNPDPALRNTSCFYGDGKAFEESWNENIASMSDWKFKGSTNIIILRLPKQFHLNPNGNCDILGGEDAYCYTNEQGETYIQPSLVVGCFFSKEQNFTINPNFEETPSEENISLWTERFRQLKAQEENIVQDFGVARPTQQAEPITTDPKFDRPLTMDDTDELFE